MIPDFLIIGAQKSGTTSLWKGLSSCPKIYMPPIKELQYFSGDRYSQLGPEGYANFFSNRSKHQLCGEASPQYLCQKIAAERISRDCYETKLIVILRDPLERAISHYRMTFRRGRTKLSLEEALKRRLESPVLTPESPDMDHDYLLLGEYGRMLNWYCDFMERNKLVVTFLADLKKRPLVVFGEITKFLGLESSDISLKNVHAHKGGMPRFKFLDKVLRNSIIKFLGRRIFSPQKRGAFMFWWETQGNVKIDSSIYLSDKLKKCVRGYFKKDEYYLEQLLGRFVPWRRK